MTRFARARGSKACNERQEEEATPWSVMRQQLTSQAGQVKLPVPPASLEKQPKSVKRNNVFEEHWSEFGEPSQKESITNVAINKKHKVNNIKIKKLNKIVKDSLLGSIVDGECLIDPKSKSILSESVVNEVRNKAVHNKNKNSKISIDDTLDKTSINKTNRIKKTKASRTSTQSIIETNDREDDTTRNNFVQLAHDSNSNISKKPAKKIVSIKNKPSQVISSEKIQEPQFKKPGNNNFTSTWYNKETHTIISNGRVIEIVRYDGFFVKKEDAIELAKLRKKLKSQNIPAEKIKMVLKLERRKAEKALARDKKAVCFQCRQFGHNFADCPEVKDSDISKSGICFKCGSTEHTHFECKISQNQSFRFAVCFVCKEQGHIARQCPVNPKGLYPRGGACHLCGDTTHLKMNCPKVVVENHTHSITLKSDMNSSNLEDISDHNLVQNTKATKKNKKIVKF